MGHISRHSIRTWSNLHNLEAFVETGTYLGASLAYARQCKYFNEFHSIEINDTFYEECSHMFSRDDRVKIWHGASDEMFPKVLSEPSLQDKNILFWLDAHLPHVYDEWKGKDIRKEVDTVVEKIAPLQKELEIIRKLRPRNSDIIIIDDLRLYAKDNYQNENCGTRVTENIDWVVDLMGDKFGCLKSLEDEGYLVIVPHTDD
jgi:hypothetical protein